MSFSFEIDLRGKRVELFLDMVKHAAAFRGVKMLEKYRNYWGRDFKPGQQVPLLSNTDFSQHLNMMPETWGWKPSFYISTKQYREHPGLLSISKAESYMQYYQEYRRCLLPVSSYSQWTKANGRYIRFRISHPRHPVLFMPCVMGYNADKSGRHGFSIYTISSTGHLEEVAPRRPVLFTLHDIAGFMANQEVPDLLQNGSIEPGKLHKQASLY